MASYALMEERRKQILQKPKPDNSNLLDILTIRPARKRVGIF